MEIDIFEYKDNWQNIKDSTMNTIGKTTGRYPTSEWKRRVKSGTGACRLYGKRMHLQRLLSGNVFLRI